MRYKYEYNVKDYKLSAPVAVVTMATTTRRVSQYTYMGVCMCMYVDNIGLYTYIYVHEY